MSLASTQADIDAVMASTLTTLATKQADFYFTNGRYWAGGVTHTSLPVDGSSSSADLSSTVTKNEGTSWDDMMGAALGSIPCALECKPYKKALYSVGGGYVVKLKFIYSGTVYERTQDSGYDSSETHAWAAVGTSSFDAPAINSISPSSGATGGGTSITLTGTGFIVGGTTTVTVGGSAATSVSVVSATSITCTTPSGSSGAQDVVVTNTDGQTYAYEDGFTYAASVPTIVQSNVQNETGSGGLTFTTSATTSGNMVIVALASNSGVGWSVGAGMGTGWTQLHSGTTGYQVFYKIVTSAYTTLNCDDGGAAKPDHQAGILLEISGVNATPVDVSAATASSATSPSVTTTVDNCLLLSIGCGNATTDYETVPSGFTLAGSRSVGTEQIATIAYKTATTAGATGTAAWDAGTYSGGKVFTVAVKP